MSIKNIFKNWSLTHIANELKKKLKDSPNNTRLDDDRGLTFSIFFANGGKIIQTYYWDHKQNERITKLYVVTDDKNFGNEIEKIISLDSLRRY